MLTKNVSVDVNFVNFLKKFESDVLMIPPRYCVIVCSTVANHLDHMFDNYVNICAMTQEDVEILIKFVKKHTQNYHVNMFILTEIMFRLRESEKHDNRVIGQHLVKSHLFKMS